MIGRQRFGVFLLLDGVPNAVAPAEAVALPDGMEPPRSGATVAGEVTGHAHHNRRVRIRVDGGPGPP